MPNPLSHTTQSKRNILIITVVLTTLLHASDIIISKLWFLLSSASESRPETDKINVDDYDKVLLEHIKGIYLILPCGIQRTFPR